MQLDRRTLLLTLPLMLAGKPQPAHALPRQERVPLPDDDSIAAHVGISAQFVQFLPLRGKRAMHLTANTAAYARKEALPAVPEAMQTRLLTHFEVPNEPGWGAFTIEGDTFALSIDIVDEQKRLSAVVVRAWESGHIVGTVRARVDGAQVLGRVVCDWDTPYYLLEGQDKTGRKLFTLGVNRGFSDRYVSVLLEGGFQPRRPASTLLPGMPEGPEVVGTVGDPHEFKSGTVLIGALAGVSRSCAYVESINNKNNGDAQEPPDAYLNLLKQEPLWRLAGTSLQGTLRVPGMPPSLAAETVQAIVAKFEQGDRERGVANIEVPPYSRVLTRLTPELRGLALAVLRVPYERIKHTPDFWDTLRPAILKALTPQKEWFSRSTANTANQLLTRRALQQQTGLLPGDVIAGGESYTLQTVDHRVVVRAAPLLEAARFQVVPSLAPSNGKWVAEVVVENSGSWTVPAPPGPAPGGTLKLSGPMDGVMSLASGYKWKVTARIVQPVGYGTETYTFQTPQSDTIKFFLPLQALRQLQVPTNGPQGPCAAHVTLHTEEGTLVAEQDSAPVPGTNAYRATFDLVLPGNYVLSASTPKWHAPDTRIAVSIGKEQSIALMLLPVAPTGKPGKVKTKARKQEK